MSLAPSVGPGFVPTTPSTPTAPHSPAKPVSPPITLNSPIQFPYQNLSPDLSHSSPNTNLTKPPSTTSLPNSPASSTNTFNESLSRHKNFRSQATRSLQFTEPNSNPRKLNAERNTYRKPICRGMSHTATHPALGSKSEIQNALKSKLDYTFVIGKARRAKRREKKNNLYRKREETKKRSFYMYYPYVKIHYQTTLHDTAPNIHYSPRPSCFRRRLNLKQLPLLLDWLFFSKLVWPSRTTPRSSTTISKHQCSRKAQLSYSNTKLSPPRARAKFK